jgi:hypothetical protein
MAETLAVRDTQGREHFVTRSYITDIAFTTGPAGERGPDGLAEPEVVEATIVTAAGREITLAGDDARRLYEEARREHRPRTGGLDGPGFGRPGTPGGGAPRARGR